MKRISRKRALRHALATALGAAAWFRTGPVTADSLWARRTPERANLVQDSRARRIGDLVTVTITENTNVNSREDKSMNKETEAGGTFNIDASSGGGFGSHAADAALDSTTTSKRKFDGGASYTDQRAFTDQITATVVDVLPNGNLVIAGQRCLTLTGEKRTLAISGVVRPIDLGPDNRISSRYIADFRSVYEGDGPSRKFVRQGWMGRAVNKIWPF